MTNGLFCVCEEQGESCTASLPTIRCRPAEGDSAILNWAPRWQRDSGKGFYELFFESALWGTSHNHLFMFLLPDNTFVFEKICFFPFLFCYPSIPPSLSFSLPLAWSQLPDSWGLAKAVCPWRCRWGAWERGQQWGAWRSAPNPQLQALLRGRVFERTCVMGRDAASVSD